MQFWTKNNCNKNAWFWQVQVKQKLWKEFKRFINLDLKNHSKVFVFTKFYLITFDQQFQAHPTVSVTSFTMLLLVVSFFPGCAFCVSLISEFSFYAIKIHFYDSAVSNAGKNSAVVLPDYWLSKFTNENEVIWMRLKISNSQSAVVNLYKVN